MNSNNRVSLDCQTPDGLAIKVSALEQEEENEFAGEEVVVVKQDEKKATSGQELQTASSKFDLEKIKVLMIDVVNPKFKSFNRPLCLALVVGMLTLASFIALCVYLQNDCVTQSMTAATMTVSKYLKENPVSCVHFAAKVTTDGKGKTSINPCRMVDMDFETEAITTMDFPICDSSFGDYEETIRVDNPDQLPDFDKQATGCPPGTFDTDAICAEFGDFCNDPNSVQGCMACDHCDANDRAGGKCPACTRRLQDEDQSEEQSATDIYCVEDGGPALVAIEFDVCPDPVLVLGSAFGWVAMIELAATLFVLAIGMPTGHLKNDQSFLKTMITEVTAEKENVQAGGIEMASTFIEA